MKKSAIVILADGFEEVEAVTPIDYLRRAGIEVTVASVGGNLLVKGARGIVIDADVTLYDLVDQQETVAAYDAVIIPGGMPGAANIAASPEASALIREMAAAGKRICAICASPAVVLAPLGILAGKKFTCYPDMEERVQGGHWSDKHVVMDGNIITSRAAGTAGEFSIAIISQLLGETEGGRIAQAVLL
ncbi:MAG: DJ-1/PfpI family protein [Treponema sp.]|nr:DJ-1/PfpI family protein [Treponema sp.]